MSEPINPLVTDLSHWEWPCDFEKIVADGYVGVIWKASQGTDYVDPTYRDARKGAKAAKLLWGAYHFGDSSDTDAQAANFLNAAQLEASDLFCLDWEPNGSSTMGRNQAQNWIIAVETALNRLEQCVLYSGNQAKESIKGKDAFFGARRLWLAQYGSTPSWQESWSIYWLWQFTDGSSGPSPHQIGGVGACDINSYAGSADQLTEQWAAGEVTPPPPPTPTPPLSLATVLVIAPKDVHIVVRTLESGGEEYGRGMKGVLK